MKKILLYVAVIAVCGAFTVIAPQGKVKLGEGAKLSYGVDFMGDEYDFNVIVTDRGKGVTFDYEMTNKHNTKGSVSISPDAMEKAVKQNNYFAGGKMQLRDATTIWVSNKVYTELKAGSTNIDIGSGSEQLNLKDKTKMNVKIGGRTKSVKVLYGETKVGNKFWIMDDKNNPIILKMEIGWTIEIKEIN